MENAKATLEQRQATLDSARIDLERTYIRSPIDGIVVDRQIEPGQTVAASLSAPVLFRIAQDLAKLEVKIMVDEADIGQVAEGQAVKFTVDAFPDETFKGKVEQIKLAPIALNNVVTYTVVIAADNPLGRLLPGMTANVEIVTGEHKDVVVTSRTRRCVSSRADRRKRRSRAMAGQPAPFSRVPAIARRASWNGSKIVNLAKRSWARFAPRSRPSSPPSRMPVLPGPGRRKRICASRRACVSPKCSAPCSRPRNTRNTRRWHGNGLAGGAEPRCGPMRTAPSRHEVRLGLTDGSVTEVVEGPG